MMHFHNNSAYFLCFFMPVFLIDLLPVFSILSAYNQLVSVKLGVSLSASSSDGHPMCRRDALCHFCQSRRSICAHLLAKIPSCIFERNPLSFVKEKSSKGGTPLWCSALQNANLFLRPVFLFLPLLFLILFLSVGSSLPALFFAHLQTNKYKGEKIT